ncbi:hypothetical protein [Synechococcus sp. UW69]|uniref:beta strand repeat-containing protein n=1 Tax=Synechococcus sp. UW69 TaxID=368493 RepID=UPI0010BD9F95|nr:hypothetical protein [Synechococcus sp. UW69]
MSVNADSTAFGIAGGKGDDSVSATFGANSAQGASVAGSLGNDTVNVDIGGGFYSGFLMNGASGADVMTFSSDRAVTFGSANSILGGTGADTINFNVVGGAIAITGASGLVVSLGAPGIVSAGTTTSEGGAINLNVASAGALDGSAFFRGTNTGDDINISLTTGSLTGTNFSGESGADSITLTLDTGAAASAISINAGAGADLFTADVRASAGFGTQTGGQIAFDGGADNDTIQFNLASGGQISAAQIDGGDGADVVGITMSNASDFIRTNSGVEFNGGSGADTITLTALTGSNAAARILGGSGADVISGSFIEGSAVTFTAQGGAGADTLNFVATGDTGSTVSFSAGVIRGDAGADSINLVITGNSAQGINFGSAAGGAGNDTIRFNLAASAGSASANVYAGGGADSIVFSGTTALGNGNLRGLDFHFQTAESTAQGFDTISFNATAGASVLSGGTMTFSAMGNAAFAKAGNVNTGGAVTAGFTAGEGSMTVKLNLGLVEFTMNSAGNNTGGIANKAFIATGGATTANIISAVDRVVVGQNNIGVFNIQAGSAGGVEGYLFVQGGLNEDTVVRIDGADQTGAVVAADLVFDIATAGNFRLTDAGGAGTGGIRFNGVL